MSVGSESVVVDAGVLIAAYDANDVHHEWSVRMLTAARPGTLAASVVTLAESLVYPAAAGSGASTLSLVRDLDLRVVELAEGDALPLAETRAWSRLRMPDAIVLHTALSLGAGVLTTDRALARAAADRGLTVHAPG